MKLPRISVGGFFVATMLAVAQVADGQSQSASSPRSILQPTLSQTAVSPSPTATPAGPFHLVAVSSNVLEAILSHLERPTTVHYPDGTVETNVQLHPVDPKSLEIKGPIPIYNISTIAAANTLKTTTKTAGKLYFVESASKPIGAAELGISRTGNLTVSSMEFTSSEPNAETLKVLEGLDPIKMGSYEVRYLQSQADGLKAIWLKPLNGGTDYVYVAPYGFYGTPGQRNGIQADKLYTLDDFLKLFLPILQERATRPDDPNAFG